jgi:hypothetical protein
MRRWVIVNGLLTIIVALLALEIVRTWGRVLPPIEVEARPAGEPGREKGKRGGDKGGKERAQQAPAIVVAAIADKDMFDPTRRPPAEEAAAPAPAPVSGPPTNLTVAGVRISGRNREVFVIDASQGNRQQRLHVGDQVAGVVAGQAGTVNYTIKAIENAGLVLTAPSGESITMPLEVDKSKGGGAPAPGGPRPTPPPRPGQVAATPPQPPASPAAGMQGASPAAGVPVRGTPPPAPAPPVQPGRQPGAAAAGGDGAANPATQRGQLPPEVQQKLEQLRQQGDEAAARPGRTGRKR